MNIGEKLYELRKEKNLSQEEVADKLNVTRQTISKWETNQTTPDFDKIIPICELYEISSNELLTGKKEEKAKEEPIVKETEQKEENKELTKDEIRKKNAQAVSTSVFIYIIAVAFIIVAIPVLRMNPIVATAIFLCIIAYATAKIIKNYMSNPKIEKSEEKKKEERIVKQINTIVGTICTIIYFIISFATMAWYITWVIFIIDGLICEVVKLFFLLNEEEKEKNI